MKPLQELRLVNPSVSVAALFDIDGALVSSQTDGDTAPDVLASFVAALRTLGERTSAELGAGELETMILDGTQGRLVLAYAGDQGFVAALLGRDAPLGQALVDVRACAASLSREAS